LIAQQSYNCSHERKRERERGEERNDMRIFYIKAWILNELRNFIHWSHASSTVGGISTLRNLTFGSAFKCVYRKRFGKANRCYLADSMTHYVVEQLS
jgi:hypothetical protein